LDNSNIMDDLMLTLDNIGDAIIKWTDPDGKFTRTEEWPLTDFRVAGCVAIAYVTFVVVGSAVMKSDAVPAIDPYPLSLYTTCRKSSYVHT